MNKITVFCEILDGQPTDISFQCLSKAVLFKDKIENCIIDCAIVGDNNLNDIAKECVARGANNIALIENLKFYTAKNFTKALSKLISETCPRAIFIPSSTLGNDLASTVACELNLACVLDCNDIDFKDGKLWAHRNEFDGKASATYVSSKDDITTVFTLKDGIAEKDEPDYNRPFEIINCETPSDLDSTIELISKKIAKKTVDLKAAKIIIAAGAGIGDKENFKIIEDLANALGGEVAASRPVVDAGWATADRQVGQTGTTVSPDLYIACGISGAVQHRVGMMGAKKVIAINNDPSAPIFKFANYCLIGDLNVIIPKLIKTLT